LLLPFVAKTTKASVDQLKVEDFTAETIRAFLKDIQAKRHVSDATRNQRLVAIHSLARFIGENSPEHLAWGGQIRAVPFKRAVRASLTYLDKPEVDALLAVPDRSTPHGARDHALLLFLFNSGARADEAAHLRVGDLSAGRTPSVHILGKGKKHRTCPLWPETLHALEPFIRDRPGHANVFLNRRNVPLTRSGIYKLVQRTAASASRRQPSIAAKRIGPHCLRHSCATHLLRQGVDINTIRGWMGHVSVETTNIYAEVDLEMKTKALEKCDPPGSARAKRWHKDPGVIAFLKGL
jgi:integrase/recombinase XerD